MATIAGTTKVEGAADLTAATIFGHFRGHAYTDEIEWRIANAYVGETRTAGLVTSGVVGQSSVETGRHAYGNQVKAGQYNFAGLGATDDGAAGGGWKTPEDGVKAHLAHWGNYLYGAFDSWPARMRHLIPYAYRNKEVLHLLQTTRQGRTIGTFGELGCGIWGTDCPYWPKVIARANELLAAEAASGKGGAVPEWKTIDLRDRLKREAWNDKGGPGTRSTTREGQVVHYSAVRFTRDMDIVATIIGEARYHIRTVGTPDAPPLKEKSLAYHTVVHPFTGDRYITRDWQDDLWHCGNGWGNGRALSIHIPGDGSIVMTPVAVRSLVALLAENEAKFGFGREKTFGHKELSLTSCPGPLMDQVVYPYRARMLNPTLPVEEDDVEKYLPAKGTAHTVLINGEPVSIVRWDGEMTEVLGTSFNDLYLRGVGKDKTTIYNRALDHGVMKPYQAEPRG